jgi:pyridoxine kinase
MSLALILSSYVAADAIGGGAQALAFAARGFDPVLVPTVLLGANPAEGGRGRAVDPDLFAILLEGVEARGVFARANLVITGHFSSPEQVDLAAQTIAKVRAAPRSGRPAVIIVDPILGDEGSGLYVRAPVAQAVAERLVPLADWITPNTWELAHLSGHAVNDSASAASAARALGRPALVTSVSDRADEIGILSCQADAATLFAHPRLANAPKGTGDLVCALFGAGLAEGLSPAVAAERAARAIAEHLVHSSAGLRIETLV